MQLPPCKRPTQSMCVISPMEILKQGTSTLPAWLWSPAQAPPAPRRKTSGGGGIHWVEAGWDSFHPLLPISNSGFYPRPGLSTIADLHEGADLTLKSWQRFGGIFLRFFFLLLGVFKLAAAAAAVPDVAGIGRRPCLLQGCSRPR